MERFYIVAYDVGDPKRWRRVFRIMNGYGDWVQLSVFQCRLTKTRAIQLQAELQKAIHNEEDHVLIMDLGPAESIRTQVTSLGRPFTPIQRQPIIV